MFVRLGNIRPNRGGVISVPKGQKHPRTEHPESRRSDDQRDSKPAGHDREATPPVELVNQVLPNSERRKVVSVAGTCPGCLPPKSDRFRWCGPDFGGSHPSYLGLRLASDWPRRAGRVSGRLPPTPLLCGQKWRQGTYPSESLGRIRFGTRGRNGLRSSIKERVERTSTRDIGIRGEGAGSLSRVRR